MKRTITFLIIALCCGLTAKAQDVQHPEQETLVKFTVMKASINDEDLTALYFHEESNLYIYKDDRRQLCFANVIGDSQSYGPIKITDYVHEPQTDSRYENDKLYFTWAYKNSYDDEYGMAHGELVRIHRLDFIYFRLEIVTDKLDVLSYKGITDIHDNLPPYR